MTAKRKLTNISFQHEGAHVALVGTHQGGPANGVTTLITKALNAPDELIEKAASVTVELEFPEFLRKFFGMYWEDAEVLSAALGYGQTEEFDWEGKTYKDFIDHKVSSINILKSVYKASDMSQAASALSQEDIVLVREEQAMLEKAMSSVLPKGETLQTLKEDNDLEKIEKSLHEELLTKAVEEVTQRLEGLLADQADVLKAAQAELDTLRAEKVEAVAKSRKEALLASGVAADKVEDVQKALSALDDEAFALIAATYDVQKAAVEGSEMFQETGVSGEQESDPVAVDRTREILKAKYGQK